MKQLYSVDPTTEIYTFFTSEKIGADYELPKVMVERILLLYSRDGGNMTAGQIASKMIMGLDMVKFVLRALGSNHNTVPVTPEDIEVEDLDHLAEKVVITSRKALLQAKVEKKMRREEKAGYENWCALKAGNIDPLCEFFSNYVPTSLSKELPPVLPNHSKAVLVVGMSDWHFGLISASENLSFSKGWNVEEAKKSVLKYAAQLKAFILSHHRSFSEIKLLMMGDIIHGLHGYTDGGTKLKVESNFIEDAQMEVAQDATITFVETILDAANQKGAKVSVYSVAGNHSSMGDRLVCRHLEAHFRNNRNIISFQNSKTPEVSFSIHDNYFLMEHGNNSGTKNRLAAAGKPRESQLNDKFLTMKMKGKADCDSRKFKRNYYLSADQHHLEAYEHNSVEGIIFPTIMSGCEWAAESGYHARARQLALVVDEEGISEMKHFYFDRDD